MNGGWIYNRVKPPEKRDRDIKEKHWRRYTVALRRTPTEIANLSKNFLLGSHLKQPTYPKNCSSDLISAFDCILSSLDRLITPINCYKTHHQPNSFTHSHKFIVLGSLGPYPIPSGFWQQFVTLQKQLIKDEFMDHNVNNIQLAWRLACILSTYRTCNSTMRLLKYEFNNKLLGGVTLLKITQSITLSLSLFPGPAQQFWGP